MEIPADIIEKWQNIVDVTAALVDIPAALIMRVEDPEIEVFVSSKSKDNPYHPGDKENVWGSGLYCETVIKTKRRLLVPNALADDNWKNNPDIKFDMISYLGFPILLPTGDVFGTICVLDSKENTYGKQYENLLLQFKELIELHLLLLFQKTVAITEREIIDDALQESKNKYRNLVEDSFDGIFVQRGQNIIFANKRLYEMLGYKEGELIGQNHWVVYHPDYQKLTRERAQARMRGEEVVRRYEVKLQRKDGSWFYGEVNARPITFPSDKESGIQVWIKDIDEGKRAEEALRESEEKYRNLVDLLPIPMFQTDDKGILIYANKAFFEMHKYPETILEKEFNCVQALAPEDRDRAIKTLSKVMNGENLGGTEYTAITKNGVKFPILVHSSRVSIKNKTIQQGIAIDITKRKQAERRIYRQAAVLRGINKVFQETLKEESEETLGEVCLSVAEELTESKIGFIGEIGTDGLLHDISISQSGWEAFQVMDQGSHRRPPGDFEIHGLYGRVLKDGKGFFTNDPAIHPDRIGLPTGHPPLTAFLGVPLILDTRTIGMIAVGNRDGGYTDEELESLESLAPAIVEAFMRRRAEIDRKRAADALQANEEKYRRLVENALIGVYQVERDGKFITANRKMAEMFGYDSPESLMSSVDSIANLYALPEERPAVLGDIDAKGAVYGKDVKFRKKDGKIFWAKLYTRVIRGKEKTIYEGLMEDLTESKRAEEERKKLENQLHRAQKMESLGLMAGGIAHDLNNILSGIVSYPELLLMELPENSPLRKPIKTIQESGIRAADVVADLMTITRGAASSKEVLDMNSLIREYLDSAEHKKLESSHSFVTFKTQFDSELLSVNGSRTHIKKTLMNLVTNASEAIEGSGTVTISIANRDLDEPLKGYEDVRQGEYAVLCVSDDGTGISPEDRERIFEPFYTKKEMGRSGTGLGLAVVWNTIQDHNGYINVESGERGTLFELYFPVTRDEIATKKEEVPLEDYLGHGERILVVDDEERQREIACGMLTKLGYNAEAVSSGEEAVEYVKKHPVDLIFLDMVMPKGINGRKTYEEIVKIHPKQKAIIASGYAKTKEVDIAQELGSGKYIRKPYTLGKIGLSIKEELEK